MLQGRKAECGAMGTNENMSYNWHHNMGQLPGVGEH